VNNTELTSGFTLMGSSIDFATAPPSGASIKVTWSQNTSLEKSFSLDVGNLAVDPESLQATVNGQVQAFTKNGTSVLFETAPEPLSTVVIKYELAKLDYDFSPGAIIAGSLTAVDQSGKVLKPVFNGSSLKFDLSEFQYGKVVTVTHKLEWSASYKAIPIPHSPIEGTLSLKGNVNGPCSDVNISSTEKTLSIKCEMPGETGVSVEYKYLTDVQSIFSAEDVAGCDKSSYQVFINHVLTSNFKVNGCKVTVNDLLPNESSVKIIVTPI
jgi:hypothetical protein